MKTENILSNLNSSINSKNEQEIIKNLKLVVAQANDVRITDINTFKKLINMDVVTVQIDAAEVIAELAKVEENRKVFTNEEVVIKLMQFMRSESKELVFTTIRALGNICYENEEGCNIVDKVGIESILAVLNQDFDSDGDLLVTKVSGLLVNLLHTHEHLPKAALKGGILSSLENLLIKYKDPLEGNKILVTFLLSILNSLTDYLDDKDYIFSENLARIIAEIFKKSEIPEICVICLEIFHSFSEKDEIKTVLAKEGVCELLYDLIEKYRDKLNDEESRSVLKMACDLIVLILTGDNCMNLLYNNSKGKTYQNMLTWLDSKDCDLLSTGVLAIGNFARKDTHCIQMVKEGIAKKLIGLLKNYNESTDVDDVKVQHALLSTLKNLVIPKENKAQVLNENIIEVMYPMLKQDCFMVIFKLLGTFRMVIDGQASAASELLTRKDFVERLVYWCYNSDHLGVRGEVPRIFSWLIKNGNTSKPFSTFVSVKGSVGCVVEMMTSNHGVMQNESFSALNILAVGLSDREDDLATFREALCESSVGNNLSFVVGKYGDKWDVCTIENCLALLENLIKSDKVVGHLRDTNVAQALDKIRSNPNAKEHQERLEDILYTLNK